ncbi:hypothetical protein Clacol_003210 [Clathrus columnatus]|uniref:BRCT domain-containing protein n=1 Tax=Clathrus columnatus TaxID=1419009 RepID=A0AAV5A6W7_9AGAM|nr:hypothetical protein Clacol_003210 [Clathrus columnatus]
MTSVKKGNIRAIILASVLPKYFTAGLDLQSAASLFKPSGDIDPSRKARENRGVILHFQACISEIENTPQPVIAAVNGYALGLAIDILAACDIRYATPSTIFSVKEVDARLASDIGTLAYLLKQKYAPELADTARTFGAEEARQIGFIGKSCLEEEMVFFSGVIAAYADICWSSYLIATSLMLNFIVKLSKSDREVVASVTQELGSKDVTHLIVTNANSEKYRMVIHFRDSASLGAFIPSTFSSGYLARAEDTFFCFYGTQRWQKGAPEKRVRLAGGSVLSASTETEGTIVDDADVLITRYHSGAAYTRALSKGKTIGSLAWFLYVDKIRIISRPRDQLLHYPIRSKPIPGFEHHEITVTNYQGDARNYLKKLIQLMGATFTPTMSSKNTVVIAAKSGSKTTKAEEWSVPVVNHKRLEDCSVEWRNLTPALKKYIDFAQGFNYGTLLGERGVGHVGLQTDPELPAEPDKEASTSTAPASAQTSKPSPKKARPKARPQQPDLDLVRTNLDNPVGTGNSFRDALEVEEVEDVLSALDNPVPSVVPIDDDRPPLLGSVTSPADDKPKPRPKPKSATLVKEQNSVKQDVKLPEKKDFVPDEEGEEPELEGDRVNEEEEEEEEVPVRTKKKQRTSIDETTQSDPKTKLKSTAKTVPKSKSESDVSVEEIPLPSKKIGLSNNTRGFSTGSSKMSKSNNKKVIDDETSSSHDDEDDNARATRTPPPAKPKSKSRSPSKSTPTKRSLPQPSSDHEIVEIKRPKVVHTYKSPTKAKAARACAASSSGDEEHSDVIEVTKVMSGHKATAQKAIRPKPTRTVAVELPDNWSVTKSIPGRSPAKPSTSAQNDVDPGIPSSSENSSIFFVSRPPPQRSAAAAASEKLRNKVMPDVINFENERKRNAASTRRRKSSLGTSLSVDDDEGSDASVRIVKKARFSMDAGESDDTPKGFVTNAKGFLMLIRKPVL